MGKNIWDDEEQTRAGQPPAGKAPVIAKSTAAPEAATSIRSPIGQKVVQGVSSASTALQQKIINPATKAMANNGIAFTPAQKKRAAGIAMGLDDAKSVASTIAKNQADSEAKAKYQTKASSLPGYRPSVDPDMTQQFKPITAEDIARAQAAPSPEAKERMLNNRREGVMHVSPDGTVEPPAGNLRTGRPAPKQQFGDEFGRVRGDRPLSAEAAAYEKERLARAAIQPQQAPPITPQQESVVKSSAVTGGKMDKLKAGAGRVRNVVNQVGGVAGKTGPLAALGAATIRSVGTDMEDYYKRFGVGNGGIIPMPKNDGTITGDLLPNIAIRELGAASDLGSIMTMGAADAAFEDKADPVQELADAGTNLAGGTGAVIAQKLLNAAMKSKPGKIARGIASVIGGLTGYSAANAAQDAVAFHAGNESRPRVAQPAQQEQPSLAQDTAQQPVTGQAQAAPTAESGAGFIADSKGNKAVWDPATQSFKGSLNNGGRQVAVGDGYTNDAGQYFAPGVYGGGLTPANRSSAILAGTTPQFAQGATQERPQGGNVHIIRDSGGDAVSRMLRDPNVPDAVKVKLQLRQGMLENDNRRIDVNERAGNRAAAVDEARIASILQGAGIDQGIKAMELENASNIRSLRSALNRETDPERRQQMADQLDVLLGQTGKFQVANIDTGEVDPDTLQPLKAAVLVNSRSGNVSRISAPPAQQKLVDKNGKELIKDPKTGQLMYAQ